MTQQQKLKAMRAQHERSLRLRATWKTQSIDGVPTKVAFTKADLRRWQAMRDEHGRINTSIAAHSDKPRRNYKETLRNLLAWLDGVIDDDGILDHARALAK